MSQRPTKQNSTDTSDSIRRGLEQGDALSLLSIRICNSENKRGQKRTNTNWVEPAVRIKTSLKTWKH